VRKIRLRLEYDGAGFHGWQRQGRRPTVQAALERAVRKVTGRRSSVVGSGRTDAGVHAEAQVAAFRTASLLPAGRFRDALNAHLPAGISVLESDAAPDAFHPMRGVRSKRYRYVILVRPARPALERRAWWMRTPLDLAKMGTASRALVGRRDFRSFATEAATQENTVRTVQELTLRRRGDRISVDVTGDGFLYNMVRAIVGTLVDVGRGRLAPRDVAAILEARDRRRAGPTAPACGLTMVSVRYD
jgi:tRNA pseudouridine38-40 synthase